MNGFYTVGEKNFSNKIFALIEANRLNQPIQWNYYDSLFQSVDTKSLGNISLEDLYKERALQLRNKYDYLILNYSGGSDSHNILMTFIKNGIKLDYIYVQWHLSLVEKELYNVNCHDRSNLNFHSEWDLTIRPDLEFISNKYPEICIEINDWTENFKESFTQDLLFQSNVSCVTPNISRIIKLNSYSNIETELADKGFSVGSIYGVEKPCIVEKDNICFFYFKDKMCVANPNPSNPLGTEYFYISPDFPRLTVEQSYKLMKWFLNNPQYRYLIRAKSQRYDIKEWSVEKIYKEYELYTEIVKSVCYPYWDKLRFQAGKPIPKMAADPDFYGIKEWDIILKNLPEFDRVYKSWKYHWKSYVDEIGQFNLIYGTELKSVDTKWFYLSNLA